METIILLTRKRERYTTIEKGKDQTRIETKEEQEQRINDEVSRLIAVAILLGKLLKL